MAVRTGAEYLAGLRDGRQVWLAGERVVDVTTNPQLAECAKNLAEHFDLQHDPAYAAVLTSISSRTGKPINRAWHLPRSAEDLRKGREMFELIERRAGGVLGRHPQYMATLIMGLYHLRDRVAAVNGAQMAATHTIYADEYLCTVNRRGDGQDETLYFSIPTGTKGIKLICRPSLSHAGGRCFWTRTTRGLRSGLRSN